MDTAKLTIGDDPMSRAVAQIAANGAAERARKVRINTDRRIVRLRAMSRALDRPFATSLDTFADMASGDLGRVHRIGCLIRARIAQIDFTGTSSSVARHWLHDAAVTRKQVFVVSEGEQNVVSLRLVTGGAAQNSRAA